MGVASSGQLLQARFGACVCGGERGATRQFSLSDYSLKPSHMFSTVSILCSATKNIHIDLEVLCIFTMNCSGGHNKPGVRES